MTAANGVGIPAGAYELAGMKIVVPRNQEVVPITINVHPPMDSTRRTHYRYDGRKYEIWAVCWDSAWSALEIFFEANGMSTPTRALLGKA